MDWKKIEVAFLEFCRSNNTEPSNELMVQLKRGFDLLQKHLQTGVHDSEFNAVLESSIINMLSSLRATLDKNNALTSSEATEYAVEELQDNIAWFIAKSHIFLDNITLETLDKAYQQITTQLDHKSSKFNNIADEFLASLSFFDDSIQKQLKIEYKDLKDAVSEDIKKKVSRSSLTLEEKVELIIEVDTLLTNMAALCVNMYDIETVEDFANNIQQLSNVLEAFDYHKAKELQQLALLSASLMQIKLKYMEASRLDNFIDPKEITTYGANLANKLQLSSKAVKAISELGLGEISQTEADTFLNKLKQKYSYKDSFDLPAWNSLLSSYTSIKFPETTARFSHDEQLIFLEFIADIIYLLEYTNTKSLGELYSKNGGLTDAFDAVINARPGTSLQNTKQLFTMGTELFKNEQSLKLLLPALIGLALRYESDFAFTSITKNEIPIIVNHQVASDFKIDDEKLWEFQDSLALLLRFKIFNKADSKDSYESLRLFGVPEMSKQELISFISKYHDSDDQELGSVIRISKNIVEYLEKHSLQESVKSMNIAELEATLLDVNDRYANLFKKMIDYNRKITEKAAPKTSTEEKQLEKYITKLCLYKEVMKLVKNNITLHTSPTPKSKGRSQSM